jgi:serine/threonine-protein kinase
LLLKSDEDKTPTGFSKDGRFLAYSSSNPKTQSDLWILPIEGDRKPVVLQGKEYNEGLAQFSPDRRWIVYVSNESGTPEVYVRPFSPDSNGASAESGGKWMISRGGGVAPRWRGSQLFYMALDGRIMAVDVTTVSQAGVPRLLFQGPVPPNTLLGFGDIAADGKRFLFVAPQGASDAPPPFTVVTNWQAGLKK